AHVQRPADGGGQHLGGVAEVGVDRDDVANQLHTVLGEGVETAQGGADEVGAGFGGEQRLRGAEAQRDVDADVLGGEDFAGLDAVAGERELDDHIVVESRQDAPFADHLFGFGGDDLGGDVTVNDVADLANA